MLLLLLQRREHDFDARRSTAALRQCCAVKLCAHITQANEGHETEQRGLGLLVCDSSCGRESWVGR